MRRIALVMAGLLAVLGCGGDDGGRPSCSDASPCAAGNYCAHTPDGNVCWPDEVAPVFESVEVSCGGAATCRRDATLRVEVAVTDDAAMGTVEVALDLDGGGPRALHHGLGDAYAVNVPLAEVPFPYFDRAVTVTVTARDEAGNEARETTSVFVTRMAWARQLASVPLWSPAVMNDGRAIVAASNGQLHFVSKSGEASTAVNVTANLLNGPASIGPDAIWVGSEDGRIYPVSTGGTVGTSCNAGAAMLGVPAISGTKAISATKGSFVAVADAAGTCNSTVVTNPAQPVVGSTGRLFVPAGGKLRSFTVLGNGALADEWTGTPPSPSIGTVFAPPAIDGIGSIWSVSLAGAVYRTNASAEAEQVPADPPVSENSTGAIILSDGSAVVGDFSAVVLRRLAQSGWTTSAELTGNPGIPLALVGDQRSLLVTTSSGRLHMLRQADGTLIWSRRITPANQALEPPNIWTEPGATTSTAYLSGADGFLYAVIVDGALDTSAPWPKAYHDPQNTSNAGVAP
jgi:hypothetical protein